MINQGFALADATTQAPSFAKHRCRQLAYPGRPRDVKNFRAESTQKIAQLGMVVLAKEPRQEAEPTSGYLQTA